MEVATAKDNGYLVEEKLRTVHEYLKACENYKEEIRPLVDNVAKSVNKMQMHVDKLSEASGNSETEQVALTQAHAILAESVQPALLAVIAKSKSEFFSRYQNWLRPHFQTLSRLLVLVHFIEHGTLISLEQMMHALFGAEQQTQHGVGESVKVPLSAFDAQDYLNGVLDVPEELVRLARNYASNKQFAKTQHVCDFLRTLIAELRLLATDICGFDLKQRVEDLRKYQLRMVESMLFDISLRNAH